MMDQGGLGLVKWEEERNGRHLPGWLEREYLWHIEVISGLVSCFFLKIKIIADQQNALVLPT